jgi:hypothetical protein
MANSIWFERKPAMSLHMNNELTGVFINTFGLSGSRLAKTGQEKKLVVYVLENNQSVYGAGMISFDIGSLPWDYNHFEKDRQFVLSVLAGIKNKLGWETLSYFPREDWLFTGVNTFEAMLLNMVQDDINVSKINEWHKQIEPNDPINQGFPLCSVHKALLTKHGCQVCMD